MPSALSDPTVSAVLDRLFADAEATDAPLRAIEEAGSEGDAPATPRPGSDIEALLAKSYMPVDRDAGRFLYSLIRSQGSRLVVEFGTSFGISAIHLAAALRDLGGGRIITTEMHAGKVATARQNLADAGLADLVEVREGDALQTLVDLPGQVDLLFLDGWKDLCLPVLKLIEPSLRPGALVVADDTDKFESVLRPYLDYVRAPGNGYVSVRVPIGDGIELSVRTP
jgi:predicted O-methyltransferase YrrM